jgi:hypothetical protein
MPNSEMLRTRSGIGDETEHGRAEQGTQQDVGDQQRLTGGQRQGREQVRRRRRRERRFSTTGSVSILTGRL